MGGNIGWKFSPLNVSACFSTTKRVMTKWMPWLDSARQIGPETTLMDFLIVVRGVITGGEEVRAEFFALRLVTLEMFTCTVQTILLGCILILRLPVGLCRWFASHSSSCPQTLLFVISGHLCGRLHLSFSSIWIRAK